MIILEKIIENKRNFQEFNSIKYERFQQLLANSSIKKVLNSIPLLLSVNEKKSPAILKGMFPTAS